MIYYILTVPPTPTPITVCTDEPAQDENAIEACSFLLDTDSIFHVSIDVILQYSMLHVSLIVDITTFLMNNTILLVCMKLLNLLDNC